MSNFKHEHLENVLVLEVTHQQRFLQKLVFLAFAGVLMQRLNIATALACSPIRPHTHSVRVSDKLLPLWYHFGNYILPFVCVCVGL